MSNEVLFDRLYLQDKSCSVILQTEKLIFIYSLMLSMHNIPGGIDKVLLLVTGTVRILVKLLFYILASRKFCVS